MHVPKYRKHAGGKAFVEWQSRRWYLPGKHGSAQSKEAYRKFVREHVTAEPKSIKSPPGPTTIAYLALRYLEWAETEYPSGPRSEYVNLKNAIGPFVDMHADTTADEFGPLALKEFRSQLIPKGNTRKYINSQINRIRRMFRWGVENELVKASVYDALTKVSHLKKHRTEAKELPKRKPVPWHQVEPVLPHLSPVVRAMVMLQWHTACRPENACSIRGEEIDRTESPWRWQPERHKTDGDDIDLVIFIGPQCQKILKPFLRDGYLFSPKESLQWFLDQQTNGDAKTRKNGKATRRLNDRYGIDSYRQSILAGIAKLHKVKAPTKPKKGQITKKLLLENGAFFWTPHQLRHAKGTAVRNSYGVEGAQAVLGHAAIDATEIYTHEALELARRIAKETG